MAKTEYLLNKQVDLILTSLMTGNRLVCQVMLHTGLRVGDVLRLTREQVSKPRFWVTEEKTGKRRIVGLPGPLREEILRHSWGSRRSGWAFPGAKPGKHRTRQAVWKDVKRAAKLFRFDQNAAPHSFRKVYAVDLMERYGDISKVKRALNHSSFEVTMIYAMADKLLRDKRLRKSARVGRRLTS